MCSNWFKQQFIGTCTKWWDILREQTIYVYSCPPTKIEIIGDNVYVNGKLASPEDAKAAKTLFDKAVKDIGEAEVAMNKAWEDMEEAFRRAGG